MLFLNPGVGIVKLFIAVGLLLSQCLTQAPEFVSDQKHRINLLVFSTDGSMLASDTGYDFAIYDTKTGRIKGQLDTPGYSPNSAIFSADEKFIITGNNDGKVRLFDTESFSLQKTISVTQWSIYNLAITSDGHFLVVDAADGTIELRNLISGTRVHIFGDKGQRSKSLALSRNNNFLATVNLSSELDLFELKNATKVFSIQYSELSPLVFCGDGDELALTRHDSVDFLSLENGTVIRTSKIPKEVVPFTSRAAGMGGYFHGQVILSPNCQTIAVNNWKSKVMTLLDSKTLGVRKVFNGSASDESSFVAAFSPNSEYIATGSTQGIVRVWRVK